MKNFFISSRIFTKVQATEGLWYHGGPSRPKFHEDPDLDHHHAYSSIYD